MATSQNNDQKASGKMIKVTRNGPYLVSGGVPMSEQSICEIGDGDCYQWQAGAEYPAQETYALCCCGFSQKKPFCDGRHVKAGFDGTETARYETYLEQANITVGPSLKLSDVEVLCAGARFCECAGGTWKLTKRSNDPESRQMAIQEACDCPSGRLVAWDQDGKAIEPVFEPSIGLVEDTEAGKMGPIWVRGGIPIESADGAGYEIRNRVTLCRCGKSSNKPFCDSSHLE